MLQSIIKLILFILALSLGHKVLAEPLPVVTAQKAFMADFEQPTSVAVDAQQRIFVVDGGKHRIVVLDQAGRVLFSFGQGEQALLHLPMAISISGKRVAVGDSGNHQIKLYDLQGKLLQVITPNFAKKPKREYQKPRPVAVFLQDDNVYWSDQANHQICYQALNAVEQEAQCFGQRGETEDDFQYPFQISSDSSGYLHIVDVINARVKVVNKKGQFISQISRFGVNVDELYRPNGLAVDAQDTVYIADNYFGTISLFKQGRFLGKLRDQQGKIVQFTSPAGLFWQNQQLYVVDSPVHKLYRLTLSDRDAAPVKIDTATPRIEISQKNCVVCHLEWTDDPQKTDTKTKPEVKAVASSKMCYSCHNGVIMDSRLLIQHGAQHPTLDDAPKDKITRKHMDERKDKLPQAFPLTADQEMLCTTCHTPHNSEDKHETLHDENHNAWMRVSAHDGDLCERCHESKQKTARERDPQKRGLNHPLAIKFSKAPENEAPGFVKEPKLQQGLPVSLKKLSGTLDSRQQLICQSCHQVHGGVSNELLTVTQEHAELCIQCHESKNSKNKKEAHHKGIHPVNEKLEKPITRKDEKITQVVCQSCHKVHEGSLGTPLLPNNAKTPDEICEDCHKRQWAKNQADARHKGVHPVNFELAEAIKFRKEQLKKITCSTCHSLHNGSVDTAGLVNDFKKTDDLCKDCHQRQAARNREDARHKGVHPVNFKLDEAIKFGKARVEQISCTTCHAVHKGSPDTPMLVNNIKQTEELCVDCHPRQQAKDKDHAFAKGVHPVKGKLEEQVTINETKIHTLGCLSCHSIHQTRHNADLLKTEGPSKRPEELNQGANKDTPALVQSYQNGELCENCHARKQAIVGSDHDLRVTAKNKKNHYDQLPFESGVCGTCHSMHQHEGKETQKKLHLNAVQPVHGKSSSKRDDIIFKEDALCLNCHQQNGIAKDKSILHFKHPFQDMILRSDKKIMPLFDQHEKVKEFGAIACITCHDPHAWKNLAKAEQPDWTGNQKNIEGTMLNSFLRHKDIKGAFCVECHGIEALPKYKYFHDEQKVRGIGVDYLK